MENLKNKTFIITGGGRGIGAEASKLIASKGANIILTCRTESQGLSVEKEILSNGYSAKFISQDVTVEDDWRQVIDEGIKTYGRIDGVVNNAGSFSWKSMNDSKLEDFKEVIDVNLNGSFLGLKYGTEAIRIHGEGGSIVMISSVFGKVGAPNTTAVSAAKGGVRLLAKAGACELGPEKIRVNSIHPGLTDTKVGKVFTSGVNKKEFIQSNIPLGRMANSDEIAKTILFLVSDESFFMTGAELTIDGGFTAG
tara:strand:- start:684 stop:1439 length:756 start_codon:yes stop_codon:yes gene_type:complete